MQSRLAIASGFGSLLLALPMVAASDPKLTVSSVADQVQVSWPLTATNWVLEQSSLLPAFSWSRVPTAAIQAEPSSRTALLAPVTTQRFYRLRNAGPPVPDQTGYWPLDEGMGEVGEAVSAAGVPLLITNAAWATGRFGAALQFTGSAYSPSASRAWVLNTNYGVLPPSGQPFSFSFWFNPESLTTGWRALAGHGTNASQGWQLALHNPGPGTNLFVFSGNAAANSLSVTGRSLLLPGQWHQLTLTHDGTNGSLYLDGRLLASAAGAISNPPGSIYFGGWVGGLDSFAGRLDEIRTYTNCLTADQISRTGDWRFDEGSGGFSADGGLHSRHSSIIGAPWTNGHQGGGLDLSLGGCVIPNDAYAVLPASSGSFSLSFRLKPNSAPISPGELMNCTVGNSNGWRLAVLTDTSSLPVLRFWSKDTGGTLDLQAPAPLTNGVWTKLDLTFNGGIATLYANGRQLKNARGAIRGSTGPLRIGAPAGNPVFDAVLDELQIYCCERQAHEIGPVPEILCETVHLNSTTNLMLRAAGPPGKTLTFELFPVVTATNGVLTHTPGSPIVTYQASGVKGPDTFAYTVSDGEFTSPPTIVSISVVKPHWLSPGGGTDAPLDGSSPVKAWTAGNAAALDDIWRTNNYYDCFYYAPGEFQTTGWKYVERGTANPGCKHIGTGASGPIRTTIKLVDIKETWNEEMIFAPYSWNNTSDGFEVHHMVLDCNATNLPKFVWGEPVWLHFPLASNAWVDSVTLRWDFGRATNFTLTALNYGTNTFFTQITNLSMQTVVIPIGAPADEIRLTLERRVTGASLYALSEIEVSNAPISLIRARIPGGGVSQLTNQYSAFSLMDDSSTTVWASGPEPEVEITLPVARNTAVSAINLTWNCQITNVGRLGPAAGYAVRARAESSGAWFDVPFVTSGRSNNGVEIIRFGTAQITNTIISDQFMLVLTNRELGVDYYSLREVSLRNGSSPVPLRLPSAMNHFSGVWNAVDGNAATAWRSGTQGAVSAVQVFGSNIKLTNLRVIGFGTTLGRECFPVSSTLRNWPTLPKQSGNILFEDCVISDSAPSNPDGLSAINISAQAPATVTNAVIRRCTVTGLRSKFTYSNGAGAPLVEFCNFEDIKVGVYVEPDAGNIDDVGEMVIRSNRFEKVDFGFYLLSHPDARFDSAILQGNEFILQGFGGGGIHVCDTCDPGTNGWVTNLTALDNIIRYADWSLQPAKSDIGLMYTDMRHVVWANNVIQLGNPNNLRVRQCPTGIIPPPKVPQNCDDPAVIIPPPTYPACVDALRPGYSRAWFNNRDLSGALLPVRFYSNGADGLASQQQWPE